MQLALCDAATGSPNSSLTSLAPSLVLLTHSSGSSEEEEDDDIEGEQAPQTFSSIDERIDKEEDVSSAFTQFIPGGDCLPNLALQRFTSLKPCDFARSCHPCQPPTSMV